MSRVEQVRLLIIIGSRRLVALDLEEVGDLTPQRRGKHSDRISTRPSLVLASLPSVDLLLANASAKSKAGLGETFSETSILQS